MGYGLHVLPTASDPLKANPPLTGAELARGLLLGAWIVLCDALLKAAARIGGCDDVDPKAAFEHFLWEVPEQCTAGPLAGEALQLVPELRTGTVFGLLTPDLVGIGGQLWGLGLLAFATVVSILVLRWRWRASGDALALGTLWGGVLVHAGPRLLATGASLTELRVYGFATGIGDLAILWGLSWIVWRFVAEYRAG